MRRAADWVMENASDLGWAAICTVGVAGGGSLIFVQPWVGYPVVFVFTFLMVKHLSRNAPSRP